MLLSNPLVSLAARVPPGQSFALVKRRSKQQHFKCLPIGKESARYEDARICFDCWLLLASLKASSHLFG